MKPIFEKDGLKIFGNRHEVPILYGWELSEKEKKQFDYLSSTELEEKMFFRYRGNVYSFDEFTRINGDNSPFEGCPIKFDGYLGDSFFSGILISWIRDNDEHIKVYRYVS